MTTHYFKKAPSSLPGDLASVPVASKLSGIRERTIWKWIKEGKVKAWGRRRCYRVSVSELLAPVQRPG